MNPNIQQALAVLSRPETQEELAVVLADLILKNPKLVSAIWEVACRCPNLVVEY